MKKRGILNRDIATVLAHLGHTDRIAIADCGLPIPPHIPCIDISLRLGEPTFLQVLDEVLEDMAVEKMVMAEEIKEQNSSLYQVIKDKGIDYTFVSHDQFKQELTRVKAIIRTGEATPYANVILQSDVIF
ncbi:D-ribose pyranase [Salipaludibacillus agaradhaerens]|jgi:D-ribose pyranase|uniref:D-ribose pyranase n=1 Tax=Salipaludibacillus agaradhaerens TaxID=76935 RepID=A0A9Q4AZ40_SALAG|nr:D-ribose pyranase [Salipaludibacillus agaradhaerens]MCR6095437.1 D-ribose pyranase [Salipaludibacillus agaradhaerens]MCR6115003.1 D-ribose pyranase [Salipaludibacillus agaradhaerens]